jgi:hypothetical protein
MRSETKLNAAFTRLLTETRRRSHRPMKTLLEIWRC